jgi:hypothetical protein
MVVALLLVLPWLENASFESYGGIMFPIEMLCRDIQNLQERRPKLLLDKNVSYPLHRLRNFKINAAVTRLSEICWFSHVQPPLNLQTMESFEGWGLINETPDESILSLVNQLRRLTLTKCSLGPHTLVPALSKCMRLEHLHIEHKTRYGIFNFHFPSVLEALRQLARSLIILDITAEDGFFRYGDRLEDETMDSLTHFEKLRTLRLQADFFTYPIVSHTDPDDEPHQVSFLDLPAGVTSLTLHSLGDFANNEKLLSDNLVHLHAANSLQELHLRSEREGIPIGDECWAYLSKEYWRHGIRVSFEFRDFSEHIAHGDGFKSLVLSHNVEK